MNKKILIIEDVEMMRRTIYRLIHRLGYEVIEAPNGQEGLMLAKENIPDLVITDLMMPQMSGHSVLKFLKLDKRTKNIPVIVLTASGKKEDVFQALKLGAIHYIVKPFDVKDLISRVNRILFK